MWDKIEDLIFRLKLIVDQHDPDGVGPPLLEAEAMHAIVDLRAERDRLKGEIGS